LTTENVVMDADDIRRTIVRMAYEILERNRGAKDLVVIGMLRRGAPVAQRLAFELARVEGGAVPVGILDPRPYRDDRPKAGDVPNNTAIPFDITGLKVILVDEVMETGRTVRAGMDGLMDIGRPACIQLVTFIDRGHRQLPIMPDYVGRAVVTDPGDFVKVELTELDGNDRVVVGRREPQV
jgi:pyrimidine operon attenuation protein / uracil phosphoribosyltransferase